MTEPSYLEKQLMSAYQELKRKQDEIQRAAEESAAKKIAAQGTINVKRSTLVSALIAGTLICVAGGAIAITGYNQQAAAQNAASTQSAISQATLVQSISAASTQIAAPSPSLTPAATALAQLPVFTPDPGNTSIDIQSTGSVSVNVQNTYANGTQTSFVSAIEGPFRQHYSANIGTGVLTSATYSDGMLQHDENWLWQNNHFNIQRIRPEEQPNGCDIAQYDSSKIWFGSAIQADILVNDVSIGHLNDATGTHGYILDYNLHKGDKLCISNVHSAGFQFVIGPDIYYHYDSYCFRGNC